MRREALTSRLPHPHITPGEEVSSSTEIACKQKKLGLKDGNSTFFLGFPTVLHI